METENVGIAGSPALVIGEESENVYLFVHGKMGCKEEAIRFCGDCLSRRLSGSEH